MTEPTQVEMQRLGDRIAKLKDLLSALADATKLMGGMNWSELGDVIVAVDALIRAETTEDEVDAALVLLQEMVDVTATEKDDQFVDWIAKIAQQEVVKSLIVSLVNKILGREEVRQSVEDLVQDNKIAAQSIPWPVILQIVMLIIEILEKFKKRRDV